MRQFTRIALVAVALAGLPSVADAKVLITVDLKRQTMHVESRDQAFDWKISSGKRGYATPPGTYGVLWMDKDHLSDEYNQTPMPNAIFFKPGFAIHGAYKSQWGRPASHGCIRLPVEKSALLFDLVKAEGAQIEVVGNGGRGTIEASASRPRPGVEGAGYQGIPDRDAYAQPRYEAAPAASAAPQPAAGLGALFGGVY